MANIISDTSITPILSSDDVDESIANTAHDELKAMMDEIQGHHNSDLIHNGDITIVGSSTTLATSGMTSDVTAENLNELTGGGSSSLHNHDEDITHHQSDLVHSGSLTVSGGDIILSGSMDISGALNVGSDADGDIYYRSAGVLKRLPKGTDGKILELASGLPSWQTSEISAKFTSAEQTLTATGTLVLAHGLSATPHLIMPYLICKTGELGYAVGEEVLVNAAGNDPSGTGSRGLSIVPDGTNIDITYGAQANMFNIVRKDNGIVDSATSANWKLIIRAWV